MRTQDRVKAIEEQTVPELLRAAAATYEQRNTVYGDSYKHFGDVMVALFPVGVALDNQRSFTRFGLLTQITSKLMRYSANFDVGGHDDSLKDLSVYAAMLREVDAENDIPGL